MAKKKWIVDLGTADDHNLTPGKHWLAELHDLKQAVERSGRVAERMWEAHRRGDVRATSGRASDFYGPGGTLTDLGDQFWRPAIAGKRGRVAAGLMLPCAPAETMRALVARFSRELGREIKLMTMPRTVLKIVALVVPFLREIDEMLYQWPLN